MQQKVFVKSLSGDYARLKDLHQELESFYKDTALLHFNNFDLIQILKIIPKCASLAERFQDYIYLSKITEETIWDFYS